MTSRIFAAAVFALLTVTAPARAAIIEFVNLDFGNGYQEIGNLQFVPNFIGPIGYHGARADLISTRIPRMKLRF